MQVPKISALFDKIVQEVMTRESSTFSPQALSVICHSVVTSRIPADFDSLFTHISGELSISERLIDFKPNELAILAWACSHSGSVGASFFEGIVREADSRLGSFSLSSLSVLASGLSKSSLGLDRTFASKIAHKAHCLLCGFGKPREVTQLAWAFASSDADDWKLFSRIAAAAFERLAEFTPGDLVTLLWAFARLDIKANKDFLNAVAAEVAARHLAAFAPHQVSKLAWALAKTGAGSHLLFLRIALDVEGRVGALDPHDLSVVAWAFARAGVRADALFAKLAAETAGRAPLFKPQDLAMAAAAFAGGQRGGAHEGLFAALAAAAAPRLGRFEPDFLAMLAKAFALAGGGGGEDDGGNGGCGGGGGGGCGGDEHGILDAVSAEASARIGAFPPRALADLAW